MNTHDHSEQRSRILIIDDLDEIRTQLHWGLKPHFDVVLAATDDPAAAARDLAKILDPHFKREEQIDILGVFHGALEIDRYLA